MNTYIAIITFIGPKGHEEYVKVKIKAWDLASARQQAVDIANDNAWNENYLITLKVHEPTLCQNYRYN